ncbi:MAG TPA: hypothetical protein VLA03_11035 [Draconibacterium sp.]|nr:hypothetical protein [Draconibacterium sp.]
MEFFRIVNVKTSETEIQSRIKANAIPEINPEIVLLNENKDVFQIGCIWGEFTIRRDEIKGGVRFSMLDCPNALSWTITTGYPPDREKVIIHLTINRLQKDQEFVDEINEFIDSWVKGIENHF